MLLVHVWYKILRVAMHLWRCSLGRGHRLLCRPVIDEVECVARGDGVNEAMFVRGVVAFFVLPGREVGHFKVYEDNEGVVNALTDNLLVHYGVYFTWLRYVCIAGMCSCERHGMGHIV